MKRFFKQIAYGLLYISIWGVLGLGLYTYFTAEPPASCFDAIQNQDELGIDCDGSCVPCELKTIKVENGEPMAFALTDITSTILVQIKNPSFNYGLRRFEYSLEAFSSFGGPRIAYVRRYSSLFPGETKYLVEPSVDAVKGDIGYIEFKVISSDWEEASALGEKPRVQILSDRTPRESKVPKGYAVSGNIVNESGSSLNVRIVALGKNRSGEIIGVSSSSVNGLVPNRTTPFSVFLPFVDSPTQYSGIDLGYEIVQ